LFRVLLKNNETGTAGEGGRGVGGEKLVLIWNTDEEYSNSLMND